MTRLLHVLLAALLVSTAAAPAAVAQSDDGILSDLVDEEDDTDWSAVGSALVDRATWRVSQVSLGGPTDAERAAQDRAALQEEFNANNGSIEAYINDRFSGNHSAWNVIVIHHVRGDAEKTQYLVADVNNSTFENATMVNSTDRTVDKGLTLEKMASDNAHAELDTFVEDYAGPNETVDDDYVDQLAAKYAGNVDPPEGVA